MLTKLKAFWEVLHRGRAVADKETWQNRAKAANALTLFISALLGVAYAFGYDLPVGGESVEAIAGSLATLWIVGWRVYRTIVDENRGLPPKAPPAAGGGDGGCSPGPGAG